MTCSCRNGPDRLGQGSHYQPGVHDACRTRLPADDHREPRGPSAAASAGQHGGRATVSPETGGRTSEHPIRTRIIEILERFPGLHKRGIRDRLGIGAGELEHHLVKLEEAGELVTRTGDGINQTVCFLARDAHLWGDEDTRILWGRHPTRPVAAYVTEHPGCTSFELAGAVELSPRAARHHLGKLKRSNLVFPSRTGNQVCYEPVKKLEAWMFEHGDTVDRPWD